MKLGIVTISYNQAEYLQEAIDSVKLSDPGNLSYVIVDPGSRDGSRDVIARNKERFARIILEPDKGPADGLNKGFAACDADVYGYLNSDDRFTPGALDFVARYFDDHPGVDLLCGAIRIIDGAGKAKVRGRAPDRFDPNKFAHGACFVWQQATFFRREMFGRTHGFNRANRVWWDSELVLDMVLAGARCGYTNTILGDFRIYGDSITGSGRLADLEKIETARFRQKTVAAGYPPMSRTRERLEQWRYKCDPLRHMNSIFRIHLPEVY